MGLNIGGLIRAGSDEQIQPGCFNRLYRAGHLMGSLEEKSRMAMGIRELRAVLPPPQGVTIPNPSTN